MRPSLRVASTIIVAILGLLVSALGVAVMIGWYTHNLLLLRVRPNFVAMAYNTALGFFLSGAAVLSIVAGQPRIARGLGACVLIIGGLTLAEYVSGSDLHFDELFMKSYVRSGISNFHRMAVSTGLCFTLTGISVLSLTQRRRGWSNAAMLCGTVVICLSVVAISGYVTGVILSYFVWGLLTRMAIHTSWGFVALGTASIVITWRDSARAHQTPAWGAWGPLLLWAAGITATVCLWQLIVV
jgi:hypothetical protein